ncbi:MAG: hypothetical protein ACKOZT_14560 [Cyanobium sp.]
MVLGAAGVLSLLLAVVYFDAFPYDALAYHGPFAAVATGLPRLSRYTMTAFMEHRYQGFPPLWRWLMAPGLGLGLPRLLLLPNLLALLVLIASCRRCLGLPWAVSLATALLFPIALFGFRSSYQDFFVGALASAAVLLLIESLRQWATAGGGAAMAWLALPLLTAGALTKFQGLFLAVLLLGLALPTAVLIGWRASPQARWRQGPLPVLLLAVALCSLHPLHNLLSHHNPFFPIAVGPFAGPELKSGDEAPAYTAGLAPLRGFVNHWLSATELDWIARGVAPSYNIDQAGARIQHGGLIDPRELHAEIRSGGSSGLAYLAAMAGYLLAFGQALQRWCAGRSIGPQGWAVLGIAPVLLMGAGLPQSHELRYYLPLLLLPALTALSWGWPSGPRTWFSAMVLGLLMISLALNFSQPLHSTVKVWRRGQGAAYALHYPGRDLPDAATCRRLGHPWGGQPQTLQLPTGLAFACRLQLPPSVRVMAAEDNPQHPAQAEP